MPLSPKNSLSPYDTSSSPPDKDTLSHRPEKDKPIQQIPISRLEKGLPTFNLKLLERKYGDTKKHQDSDQTKGNTSIHVVHFVIEESIHSDR